MKKLLSRTISFGLASFLFAGAIHAQSQIQNYGRKAMTGQQTAMQPWAPFVLHGRTGELIQDYRIAYLHMEGGRSFAFECVVDFNDEGALSITETSLYFDRIYIPWYQACGGPFVDIRPVNQDHYHVGYEDSQVLPCPSDPQAFPSYIDEDGTCNFVDVRTEPRTHLRTHTGNDWLLVRGYLNGNEMPFDLTRIRVKGSTPIRLCYRKDQQVEPDEWLTTEPGSKPGVWYCWNQLNPGYYDLSEWVWNVTDVKITATNHQGSFSLDDLSFGF